MKKALAILSLSLTLLVRASWADLAGSPHDFSKKSWNPTGQSCVVCHTPHDAQPSASGGVLWNRPLSNAVYTVYKSPTLHVTPGPPDGSTRLCLSCHDGTVAIDSFGEQTGSEFIPGHANLGTDLSRSHPVSFVYDSALAALVKTLRDPASSPSGLGRTISQDMLRDGKVQCVSCHDVHNHYNHEHLLIKDNRNSALCLTCHNL